WWCRKTGSRLVDLYRPHGLGIPHSGMGLWAAAGKRSPLPAEKIFSEMKNPLARNALGDYKFYCQAINTFAERLGHQPGFCFAAIESIA
ncbi:MAG: hypothetical protein ACK5UX_12745, partial [Burkholderiales bacterium]